MPLETHFLGSGRFSALIVSQVFPPRALGPRAPHTSASSYTLNSLSFWRDSGRTLELWLQVPKCSWGSSLFWVIWSPNVENNNNNIFLFFSPLLSATSKPWSHERGASGDPTAVSAGHPLLSPACHLQPVEGKQRPDHHAGGKCHWRRKAVSVRVSPFQRPTWIFWPACPTADAALDCLFYF